MGAARGIDRRRIRTIGAIACAALAGCTLQEAGRTDTAATAGGRQHA
jgi:hypothetical protein